MGLLHVLVAGSQQKQSGIWVVVVVEVGVSHYLVRVVAALDLRQWNSEIMHWKLRRWTSEVMQWEIRRWSSEVIGYLRQALRVWKGILIIYPEFHPVVGLQSAHVQRSLHPMKYATPDVLTFKWDGNFFFSPNQFLGTFTISQFHTQVQSSLYTPHHMPACTNHHVPSTLGRVVGRLSESEEIVVKLEH